MLPQHLVTAVGASAPILSNVTTPSLNVTALTAANGVSLFECWQLAAPFLGSAEPGIAGAIKLSLGEMGNASYAVIPPRFDGGFHHAPAFQFVVFLSGLAQISLYEGDEQVWVHGGKYGLIIAADTADRTKNGHRTQYPSASDTIAMEIPIRDREGFKYSVLHSGACRESDMTGL
ncbi:hypothetical protein E4U42_003726 [Claviceps africana]|uniref:Uncharacterized protein n=1 Tax=Claviceps africana TaxID=83212 RepID=A0A8K0J6X8_9HYPO|nr:hypothetical protein E4U42_003726 [Claviceps africana]